MELNKNDDILVNKNNLILIIELTYDDDFHNMK